MNILVVDDEKEIADVVELYLQNDQYKVFKFYNGQDALDCINSTKIDLAILDIMLPDEDGVSILKKLKSRPDTENIPVIMMTAKSSEYDKVLGLDSGADDYVTKPFNPLELTARVKSQLRRYTQLGAKKEEEKPNVYTVGPIVLDEEKKSVTVDGDEVALTPIEFNILRLLMKNPGRIYSSAQIYELVWKEDSLGAETSVSVHIRHLRAKLKGDENISKAIETVRGIGYRFARRTA